MTPKTFLPVASVAFSPFSPTEHRPLAPRRDVVTLRYYDHLCVQLVVPRHIRRDAPEVLHLLRVRSDPNVNLEVLLSIQFFELRDPVDQLSPGRVAPVLQWSDAGVSV